MEAESSNDDLNDENEEPNAEYLSEFDLRKENDKVIEEIRDVEVVEEIRDPEVGMEFNSIDESLEYYIKYGNQKGFPVKRRSSEKNDDGEVKCVSFACARSGFTMSTSKKALNLRPVSKSGCKAKVRATLCFDGKWRLSAVTLDHNHDLSPGKSRFYKKNRIMRSYVKRRLELNDRAGIRPNKNFNSFVVEAGGHENVQFLQKDCYNYLDKVRQLRLGNGDAVALQTYFQKMQSNNSNFFYLMDLDEDGRVRNVFWADARSREACKEFGDAITFDTTYLTNKYDMPFAPFVGVNHHGQSILLGCGLISNEDVESFIWLFKSWLVCMNNSAPAAIITDQDKAMKKAIEVVFPNSRHRWCLWHIMKKFPEKLRGYNGYESIKYAMQNAVYDSLTCEEFEGCWNSFVDKFNLHENEWLNGLYYERSRWVPTFLKNTFWAGMSSTQRSESMNAFFDGYVNSKTSLKQFVEQYENALRSKVQKENEADFNSFNHWIPCITTYPLEKQFQETYTTEKFKEFQEEVRGMLYCAISSFKDERGYQLFDVREDMFYGRARRATFKVCFKDDDCDVKCNCQLFEFRGILCRHALTVLLQKQVYIIPDKFIIRRWRKYVKRCHTKVKIIYSDRCINPENERFNKMCNEFYEAADLATSNEEKTKLVMSWIRLLINELKTDRGACESNQLMASRIEPKVHTPSHSGDVHLITKGANIRSPLAVNRKGRPRFKRMQSKTEQVIRQKIEKKKKKEDEKGKMKEKRRDKVMEKEKNKEIQNNIDGIICEKNYIEYGSHGHATHGSQDYMTQEYIAPGSLDLNLLVPSGESFSISNMYSTFCFPPLVQDFNHPSWSGEGCDMNKQDSWH